MLVERQKSAGPLGLSRREGLDGVIVGDEGRGAGIGDPLQEPPVTAIEHGAAILQHLLARAALHLEQHLVEARAETDQIAPLDLDAVGIEYASRSEEHTS